MRKFLKKMKKSWKEYWEEINKEYEEKEEEKEKKRKLVRIKIAAYKLGTKNALKPSEVFRYIIFPKILKFSMYSILIALGISAVTIMLLGYLAYGIIIYVLLPISILFMIL